MSNQLLLNLVIRSFAPPMVAMIVVSVWRKLSASIRRMVWMLSFVALAVLPLALLKLPPATVVGNYSADAPAISVAAGNSQGPDVASPSKVAISAIPAEPAPTDFFPSQMAPGVSTVNRVIEYAVLLWVLGAVLVFSYWLVGLVRLSRLRLLPVHDEGLTNSLESSCRRLGLKRPPQLLTCSQVSTPMVFGHFSPRLVLPIESECWTPEAIQAVFLHECAHLRRRDWLSLTFSRWIAAIYWFNPLIWFAASQLRSECEAAADDCVLLSGVSPSSYANELLRIATDAKPSATTNSLAFIELGSLKKRIERVLERNQARGAASPRAIGLSLILSLALAAAFGFTYQTVAAKLASHDGYVNLGHGRFVRIVAIVKRTATGSQAWNVRGEPLPNSFPLPDGLDDPETPIENLRYIVFGLNSGSIGVEGGPHRGFRPSQSLETITSDHVGGGYYVTRIDGDSLYVASIVANGKPFASIHCKVWSKPILSPADLKNMKPLVFDRVAMNPAGPVTESASLDLPSLQTASSSHIPGALLGVADLSHPEWGFWRPDGTPLPRVAGLKVPIDGNAIHPKGNITRRIGLLFRGRTGSADTVSSADVSGVLLASSISVFHTPSGRYDLDTVFVDPDLHSMRVIAKAPKADTAVAHLKLTRISPAKVPKKVSKFFSNRIAPPTVCFTFDRKRIPAGAGNRKSLQFLSANNSTPLQLDVSTDWDDGAVAVSTGHAEKIVAANVLQHGFDYYSYSTVALFPRSHR